MRGQGEGRLTTIVVLGREQGVELCGLKKSGKDGVCADGQTKKVTASKRKSPVVYRIYMGLHPAVFSAGHGTWTEQRAGWQFDHAHASPYSAILLTTAIQRTTHYGY